MTENQTLTFTLSEIKSSFAIEVSSFKYIPVESDNLLSQDIMTLFTVDSGFIDLFTSDCPFQGTVRSTTRDISNFDNITSLVSQIFIHEMSSYQSIKSSELGLFNDDISPPELIVTTSRTSSFITHIITVYTAITSLNIFFSFQGASHPLSN